ncbi:MAG: hypothetical protein KGR69_00735 [Verrucomicrobia bacterium]|nr:hypothetical protein [Verrucomicrobiota bacterium]
MPTHPTPSWYLIDCQTKSVEAVAQPRLLVDSGGVQLIPAVAREATLHLDAGAGPVLLNGIPIGVSHFLDWESEYFLKAGSRFFLVKGTSDPNAWLARLNLDRWILQDLVGNRIIDSVPLAQLSDRARQLGLDPDTVVTTVQGAEHSIYLRDLAGPANGSRPVAASAGPPPLPAPPGSAPAPATALDPRPESSPDEEIEINTVSGEFTCPHCWQHFDRGDVMWVAKHPSLRDPDLGDEFPLRFFPTSFDAVGRAIDGMGLRCTDMACPNCKSRLPPQFLDLPSHIFSVVGAPSAGKSYFLTSMVNQLEEILPSRFGLSFQDGDASGNALLSNMRARLFSDSRNPAEIALDKTVPGGEMFRTWERDGRSVKLPKPFTYLVAPFREEDEAVQPLHLIFYDNAGEQFEPAERSEGSESSDEDATRHLASSDAIFFLYDPATNVKFRRKIAGKNDPQISDDKFLKLNRQDNIIAEMRIRIKSELFLDAREKLGSPLAMLVGKCDLWADLLGSPLVNPVTERGLSLEAVARNSDLIRGFLLETSPAIVGNAEAISTEVVYFPVSPIGHSPQPFIVPGGQAERIGPVPGRVAPRFVEVPVIWTLARLYPDLIRIHHEPAGSAATP